MAYRILYAPAVRTSAEVYNLKNIYVIWYKVWDQYLENSLKQQARNIRGTGQRRRVLASSPIPNNWQKFLRVDSNKVELFSFLNAKMKDITSAEKTLTLTDGEGVICVPQRDTFGIAPCNHEEADSRIMVHAADAFREGFTKLLVRSVDTDVVVLAVALIEEIQAPELKLWIAFGTGKDLRYIAAHEICAALGPRKSLCLPMFHAFTGCDTVTVCTNRKKNSMENLGNS